VRTRFVYAAQNQAHGIVDVESQYQSLQRD
jgi:hypothetical protein